MLQQVRMLAQSHQPMEVQLPSVDYKFLDQAAPSAFKRWRLTQRDVTPSQDLLLSLLQVDGTAATPINGTMDRRQKS